MDGRSLLSFASLSAGVTPQAFNRGTQFGAAGSSRSQYVTVEGGRDSSTNYAIDGVYVRSLRFNNLSLNPPLDAVQEVNVLRNSFTTEYGQGQAVVSIVTKSGIESPDRFRLRVTSAATGSTRRTTSAPEARRPQRSSAPRAAGRSAQESLLRVWRLRRTAVHVPGTPFLAACRAPRIPGGRISRASRRRSRDPLTGQPFPGNVIPSSRFSNFAQDPRADRSGAEQRRREQLPDGPRFHRRRRHGDDPRRSDAQPNHNLFQRFMYYKGSQLQPERVQLHEPSAERQESRRRAIPGSSRPGSSTRSDSATTTPTT